MTTSQDKPTPAQKISRKPVPMQLGDDEATRRLVEHAAKRVVRLHEAELKALAYK